ncbi:MAG TPA: arginine--tRNA ligase [Acidimicrobiales bacterium]|nr:arginine--tRNA ligase [Acidimicrobiales bacterium]
MDAFERLVTAALGGGAPSSHAATPVHVESVPQSRRGDVRATVDGRSRPADLAAAAAGAGIAERWEVDGSWLYLRLPVASMVDAAAAAVLEDGDRYGAGACSVPAAVELRFSDPNLNKPLHLGHLRNNFLGMALSGLYADAGAAVRRVTVHSDWGRHVAQTVVAYRRFGRGTPDDAGIKGDHFVGRLYTRFHAHCDPALHSEADDVLRRMHEGDPETCREAARLTRWCEAGIAQTYERIGSTFDEAYRESDFVGAGIDIVRAAHDAGLFRARADGAVVATVERDGDDAEVVLLRPDGTPVFFVATLGIDHARYVKGASVVQVGGAEWRRGLSDYVQLLERLQAPWLASWRGVYYGMVELPEGRMQSRAGRFVDADALLADLAAHLRREGRLAGAPEDHAVAALKLYVLRVPRRLPLAYDRDELLRFSATGYRRVAAVADWAAGRGPDRADGAATSSPTTARRVAVLLNSFPAVLQKATERDEPATVAQYVLELARWADALRVNGAAPDRLRRAIGTVLGRCEAVLNLRVPVEHAVAVAS